MPVNPAERAHRSFVETVLPAAVKKEMGIIAMKVYLRGLAARLPMFDSLEPFLRFALSHPVSTAVIGCDDLDQMEENVSFARLFTPMPPEERQDIETKLAPYARQLMYYKP